MTKMLVEFRSKWQEGVVSSAALLDLETGEVSDIEMSDEGASFEHLIEELVVAGGIQAPVAQGDQNRFFLMEPSALDKFRELAASYRPARPGAPAQMSSVETKTAGQLAYERELECSPTYGDGGKRPEWKDLSLLAKEAWERNPAGRLRPNTKLVRVRLAALTRVEYAEVIEVPTDATDAELDAIVDGRYDAIDGGLYQADPDYWEPCPGRHVELFSGGHLFFSPTRRYLRVNGVLSPE